MELAGASPGRRRSRTRPPRIRTPENPDPTREIGDPRLDNLERAWSAPTTTDKDRKRLLRSLLAEVNVSVHRHHDQAHAELLLRWKGCAITELTVPIKRSAATTTSPRLGKPNRDHAVGRRCGVAG
jgi:hypothetical protein